MRCNHPGVDWDIEYFCTVCKEVVSKAELVLLRKLAEDVHQIATLLHTGDYGHTDAVNDILHVSDTFYEAMGPIGGGK